MMLGTAVEINQPIKRSNKNQSINQTNSHVKTIKQTAVHNQAMHKQTSVKQISQPCQTHTCKCGYIRLNQIYF